MPLFPRLARFRSADAPATAEELRRRIDRDIAYVDSGIADSRQKLDAEEQALALIKSAERRVWDHEWKLRLAVGNWIQPFLSAAERSRTDRVYRASIHEVPTYQALPLIAYRRFARPEAKDDLERALNALEDATAAANSVLAEIKHYLPVYRTNQLTGAAAAVEGAVMTLVWQRIKQNEVAPRINAFLELNELKLRLRLKRTDAGLAELYDAVRAGLQMMPNLDGYPGIDKVQVANDAALRESQRFSLAMKTAEINANPSADGTSIFNELCQDQNSTSLAILKNTSGMSAALSKIADYWMSQAPNCR